MKLTITGQSILERYGNSLARLSDLQVKQVMARALNHEGDKGRTQISRALVTQTGIKYGLVMKGLKTIRASSSSLEYKLVQKGDETNLNLFNARQMKSGVSAAPWNVRRIYPGSFTIGKYANKVFKRTGPKRFPIRPLYGPNLAREIVKGEAKIAFERIPQSLAERVGHEIYRELLKG